MKIEQLQWFEVGIDKELPEKRETVWLLIKEIKPFRNPIIIISAWLNDDETWFWERVDRRIDQTRFNIIAWALPKGPQELE